MLAVAVGTALVYAVWVLWIPLLPTNLYAPLLDLGKITGYRWQSALLYLSMVLVLYALYAYGYWRITRGKAGEATALTLFAAGVVFCAELLWAYPATAADVFGYIADGRLFALHHVNPFLIAPSAYPSDPIVPFLAYPDEPSQYGPVWVLLGGDLASLAQGDLLTELLLYKLLAAAAHIGGAALVYRIALNLTRMRTRAQASAFLYLWNPMLLWEMVGNAHNDGLMMFFGLVGVWLFVSGYHLAVLATVAAGALVKIPAALVAPTLLVGIWRRTWLKAVEGSLLAAVLVAAVYRPFWQGPDTLTALQRADLFTASLGSVLRLALEPSLGQSDASSVARTVSLSAFAVIGVISFLFAIKAQTAADTLRAAYFTLLAALLLLTTWFQAWYVVWPFAVGAALAEPRRHLEVALLSLGGLLQYFVFIYLWVMGVLPSEDLVIQSAAYAAIIGPPLIGLLWWEVRSATTCKYPSRRASSP